MSKTENNPKNVGKGAEYKSLACHAFPEVWLHLVNLGQSLFFSSITCMSAGTTWPSFSEA